MIKVSFPLQDLSLLLLPVFVLGRVTKTTNCEASDNRHLLARGFQGSGRQRHTDELGPQSRVPRAEIEVSVGVQSDVRLRVLLQAPMLLAEFLSLQWQDWGLPLPAACQLRSIFSSSRSPTVPAITLPQALSTSRPVGKFLMLQISDSR